MQPDGNGLWNPEMPATRDEASPPVDGLRRFASTAHPGDASAALVYARALVAPLGACSLPVMLGALAAALQGFSLVPFLVWGFPAALFVAVLWTRFHLRRTLAEIHVRPDAAAVRTVADCLGTRAPPRWQRVFDLRVTREALHVALGRENYTLSRADWPAHDTLQEALRRARRHAFDPTAS